MNYSILRVFRKMSTAVFCYLTPFLTIFRPSAVPRPHLGSTGSFLLIFDITENSFPTSS